MISNVFSVINAVEYLHSKGIVTGKSYKNGRIDMYYADEYIKEQEEERKTKRIKRAENFSKILKRLYK